MRAPGTATDWQGTPLSRLAHSFRVPEREDTVIRWSFRGLSKARKLWRCKRMRALPDQRCRAYITKSRVVNDRSLGIGVMSVTKECTRHVKRES